MARRRRNALRPPPVTNAVCVLISPPHLAFLAMNRSFFIFCFSLAFFHGVRNRPSPARLVKLNNSMTPEQRKMIEDINFGGILQISCHTIPADLAKWLLTECFDPEAMELVLPGRGRIPITEEVVEYILGLPNSGGEVAYDHQAEAIKFISTKYNIDQGTAPKIEEIFRRVKNKKDANEDFVRSWLMLAVSTFLCPTTTLHINPRCYPDIMDLDRVKDLNWTKFVVKQLKDAGSKLNTKGSKGCVFVLVVSSLYSPYTFCSIPFFVIAT
jgi:hypothetical protein